MPCTKTPPAKPADAPPGEMDIHCGDNLPILRGLPAESFDLIYVDPPFNTGKTQKLHAQAYKDSFENLPAFLAPRLREARRLLRPQGAFFLHLDYREAHYCKVLLDEIFGRASFMNEIIWAYDYGGRAKNKWPAKHDNIFWYAKNPDAYTFNYDAMERIPYMAPGLAGPAKAARGKTPTDVWWHTIVPTQSRERTGYPTQKPLGIITRLVKVHSNPGERVLDFFAGSGTTGEAAARLGRHCTLIESNPAAVKIMAARLAFAKPRLHGC